MNDAVVSTIGSPKANTAGVFELADALVVPASLDDVFAFFDRPENLGVITPPWLGFKMLTPAPVPMHPGSVIDYVVRVRGISMRWTSVIAEYDPPHRFSDVQLRGPYSFWHHTHTFEAVDGGTRIADRVCYAPPFGPIGRLLNAAFIRRDVQSIFRHRRHAIEERFGPRLRADAV